MQAIAPFYEQLASQHPHGVFLKVDVDKLQPIAAKYGVTAMPTFVIIKESGVVESIRGADQRALYTAVAKYAVAPSLPPDAEKAKAEGNKAFSAGDYAHAVECYTRAIAAAPNAAVLYGNRAYAYIKLAKSPDIPKVERQTLRPKAVQDAVTATTLDERWGKGWVRMAEALLLATDEEANEGVVPEKRPETRRKGFEGVEEELTNAVGLSDGKVKAGESFRQVSSKMSSYLYDRGGENVGRCASPTASPGSVVFCILPQTDSLYFGYASYEALAGSLMTSCTNRSSSFTGYIDYGWRRQPPIA